MDNIHSNRVDIHINIVFIVAEHLYVEYVCMHMTEMNKYTF